MPSIRNAPPGAGSASITLGLLLGLAATLGADDFWLVPNAFQLAPGDATEVLGQTSSRFPTSKSAVAPDRVVAARLLSQTGEERISDLSISGKSLRLSIRPNTPGQYVVAASLHPRSVRESAESFRRYLDLEGAAPARARIERDGLLAGRDSLTRRYAKYAKTLVQVGGGGGRAFGRVAGHTLEFVLDSDPATLTLGERLPVRLLFNGRPAAGVRVHAGAVEPTEAARAGEPIEVVKEMELVTDPAGALRVPITGSGLWNVRTIHIVQAAPASGADWDAHWATFVFHVPGAAGSTNRLKENDSSTVANLVSAYHRALSTGDSAAALALLAPDAVILESGGMESREEYRSHHLPGDIQFAKTVASVQGPLRVKVVGDVAWATSTSVSQGRFNGRDINSVGAELMVLTRTAAGWRINAIHWSSRARRP
ncbi:MAG: DUF4198 domain-containing protein [Gemmatimonadaceae bacterium]